MLVAPPAFWILLIMSRVEGLVGWLGCVWGIYSVVSEESSWVMQNTRIMRFTSSRVESWFLYRRQTDRQYRQTARAQHTFLVVTFTEIHIS